MASRTGWTGRVLIGAVAAMLLVALAAVPGFGASKQYTLDVKPNSAVQGVSTDYTITLRNTSPGNSTINSFSVTVPWTTNLAQADVELLSSTNLNASATLTPVGSQVRVQKIDPLKTNQVVKLRVTATMPQGCNPAIYAWTAIAYAGNSLSGDQFANQGTLQQRQVINESCVGIRFVSGHTPQDAVKAKVITGTAFDESGPSVQVEYVVGGVRQDLDTGTVTLSYGTTPPPPSTAGTLSGFTAPFTDGVATFNQLRISYANDIAAGGDYTLIATYIPSPPTTYTTASPSFGIFDSQLCNGGAPYEEQSQSQTDAGKLTIASETPGCFGIVVNNFAGATGTGNVDEWSVIKSVAGGTFIQGTFAINWDLGNGTDPVPWTQVTWDGIQPAPYHNVQLCIAGETGLDRFPGTEQICLLTSQLVQVGTHWEQAEQFAFNTDLGGRKP